MPRSGIKSLIIYPMDLLGSKLGGIQTYIKNFIKYAPDDFDISFVGVSTKAAERPVGKWQRIELYSRQINFLPLPGYDSHEKAA